MQRIDNPQLNKLILAHLSELYNLKQARVDTHLSTLVYCLTRSFLDRVNPLEPTDEEVMLFALGLGLQDILTPRGARTPVYELEGIKFSPDFQFGLRGYLVELKTTRMSLRTIKEHLPETWLEYIMGGIWIKNHSGYEPTNSYELSSLLMMGSYSPPFPLIHSETLVFTDEELQANWNYLQQRKAVYEEALENNKPPEPFRWCKDWECKLCRYKLICEAIKIVKEE